MNDPDLPPMQDVPVAVIGAGMAGLTAARKLAKAGALVTVFEKSRGLGGRLATRRLGDGAAADHGAQYVTAREPGFKAWAARAKAVGVCASWTPRGKDGEDEWLVGLPGMNGLAASLVDGFAVATERRVSALLPGDDGRLRLALEAGPEAGPFDRVVVAIPAPQAHALLEGRDPVFERIAEARFGPCWTFIAHLPKPFDPGFDVVRDVESLAWIARSASKPGRQGEIVIAQADPNWSREHLEEQAETVKLDLLAMLTRAVGPMADAEVAVHRWRYALVEKPIGETFLLSADGRIGACGDWMIAPRVESAWASGDGLAEAMIARARAGA